MAKQKIPSEAEIPAGSPDAGATQVLDADGPRAAAPDTLRGSIDFLEHDMLYGSAWDTGDHSRVVEVEIYCGEDLLDTIASDKYRHDLALAGIGDGRHGFEYALPPATDVRSVRVIFARSGIVLSGGPFFRPDAHASSPLDQPGGDDLSQLKAALGDVAGRIENVAMTLQDLDKKLDSAGERTKLLAARQDIGKVHNSLMSSITETRGKVDEIVQSGNRIEGFLNIELGKRITKELDMNGLSEQVRRVEARLRSASLGRLVITVLVLGLITAFLLTQPIDWSSVMTWLSHPFH